MGSAQGDCCLPFDFELFAFFVVMTLSYQVATWWRPKLAADLRGYSRIRTTNPGSQIEAPNLRSSFTF